MVMVGGGLSNFLIVLTTYYMITRNCLNLYGNNRRCFDIPMDVKGDINQGFP